MDYVLDKLKQRPDSKAFLFVDACRAGAASSKDFVGDSERTGVIFFAAARSDQNSVEDPNFRHGVFTRHCWRLRGQGDADADHNNRSIHWNLKLHPQAGRYSTAGKRRSLVNRYR
jgi:hypothetical protein